LLYTKSNYIEDKSITLGYRIFIQYRNRKSNDYIPIPEILSFEAFDAQNSGLNSYLKNDYCFNYNSAFKSSMGEYFSHWFPIYLDKSHFEKNKQLIFHSFLLLKFGKNSLQHKEFHPNLVFEIIPNILNKMIINILNNKNSNFSLASIKCYFNFIMLFKKLTEIYLVEFKTYLLTILKKIKLNENEINKDILPDIGNFFVLLFFSDFYSILKPEIIYNLFEEYITRQFYWVLHSKFSYEKINNLINEILITDKNFCHKFYIENLKESMKKEKAKDVLFSNSPPEIFSLLKDTNKNKLLDFYYQNTIQGNKLLIISYLASEKIKDKNFLENLERYFGVISDSDAEGFLHTINDSVGKIKSLFGLANALKMDKFFESKRESFDKFLFCYFRAQQKKYVDIVVNQELKIKLYNIYKKKDFKEKENIEEGFTEIKKIQNKNNTNSNNSHYQKNHYNQTNYYNSSNKSFYNQNHNFRQYNNSRKINNNYPNFNNSDLEEYPVVDIGEFEEKEFFI